jgi:hypothetical protein
MTNQLDMPLFPGGPTSTKGDPEKTILATFQSESVFTPEWKLLDAERQLKDYTGNKFASPEWYALKAYAKEARRDYNEWKAEQEASTREAIARRSLTETASADYLKKSATELEAAEKSLRNAASVAQDALTEFLSARQELEDNLTRVTITMQEKGLTYEDACKNGASSGFVRLNGKDYVRPQSGETFLAALTVRVAQARIRNHGGLLANYLSRWVGIRTILNDVSLPKPATFPAISRALRADIHDMPGLFIEPDKNDYGYKEELAKAKRRGLMPMGSA